jgi:hypothetical protein
MLWGGQSLRKERKVQAAERGGALVKSSGFTKVNTVSYFVGMVKELTSTKSNRDELCLEIDTGETGNPPSCNLRIVC